jgi:hypothetical protein
MFRRGAEPVDLNSLVQMEPGWVLTYASGVNNAGQIAATAAKENVTQAVLIDPLLLKIEQISISAARLSWPIDFPGYTLQTTTDVAAAIWPASDLPVSTMDGNYVVTIDLADNQRFFRLAKP